MSKQQPEIIYVGNSTDLEHLEQGSPMSLAEMQNGVELGEDEHEILQHVGLSNREYTCLKSYFWDDMTQEEIAEMLDITQQAVAKYIKKGKAKLKKRL